MKTIAKAGIILMLLFSGISLSAKEEDPFEQALIHLREQISKSAASLIVSLSDEEESETFTIFFTITENNSVHIRSVKGSEEYVCTQLKKKLEGLAAEGRFNHMQIYSMRIRYERKPA